MIPTDKYDLDTELLDDEQRMVVNLLSGIPVDRLHNDYWISEDGRALTYRYRVIFGYRLRASFVGDTEVAELDICCGASPEVYTKLRERVHQLMDENIRQGRSPFEGIPPFSMIKPYFKDANFVESLFGSL
jgi:hypothetical protein